MSVVLVLEGLDELGRAEQRQLGRTIEELAEEGVGFNGLEAGVVMDPKHHPDWDGGNCPECNGTPVKWQLTGPEEDTRIGSRCGDCGTWLERRPTLDVARRTETHTE